MKITIDGNYVRALFDAVAKEDVRTYLRGFHIDACENKLIATDGHRALFVPVEVENSLIGDKHFKDGMTFAIPRKPAKHIMKVTIETGRNPERYEEIVWTYYDKHSRICDQLISHLVSGIFPDIRDVISSKFVEGKLWAVRFNPVYLYDVYKSLGFNDGVKLNFSGEVHGVIKVNFGRDSGIEYYMMPMRL